MENRKAVLAKKIERIEELTKDFSISKYNLLKISFLIRLIEVSDVHSDKCSDCKKNEIILTDLIDEIPMLDDIKHRKPYEKEFNRIRKHFHQKHGFIPPYYYTSRWSLGGAALGIILALLISFFVTGTISLDANLAGAMLGVILGYIISSFKELKYRKMKKII